MDNASAWRRQRHRPALRRHAAGGPPTDDGLRRNSGSSPRRNRRDLMIKTHDWSKVAVVLNAEHTSQTLL